MAQQHGSIDYSDDPNVVRPAYGTLFQIGAAPLAKRYKALKRLVRSSPKVCLRVSVLVESQSQNKSVVAAVAESLRRVDLLAGGARVGQP